jgi:hypothetical protein
MSSQHKMKILKGMGASQPAAPCYSPAKQAPSAAMSDWMSADFISEEHCSLCAHMWRSEREAFRANLDMLRLDEGPICTACLIAFWRNMGLPVRDGNTTEH